MERLGSLDLSGTGLSPSGLFGLIFFLVFSTKYQIEAGLEGWNQTD